MAGEKYRMNHCHGFNTTKQYETHVRSNGRVTPIYECTPGFSLSTKETHLVRTYIIELCASNV